MRLIPLLAVMAFLAGCATRKPAPVAQQPPARPPLVDVAALIRQGCYRCLEEAFAVAAQQQQSQLAFEAASLLVLRSKELGIPPDAWLERAHAMAGVDGAWTEILQMVAAVPPDPLGGDREAMSANPADGARIRALLPTWRDTLRGGGGSSEFRTYLETALVCSLGPPNQRDQFVDGLGDGLSPLLAYRAGLCSSHRVDRLRPLAEAGFVDAEYTLGRAALEGVKDEELALRHFQTAAAAFPTSLSIGTSIGNIHIEWEDWQAATTAFDAVLAVRPAHPDALIGRTISVSRMGRYQDGIDTATRLVGGTWYLGQAFYWRAWNYHGLKNYTAARAEMDRTRTLMVNAQVFLLSGLIDWALEGRPLAEQEFQEALSMDFGQCEAAFYLGGVRAEMRKAPEGIAAFTQALQCYDLSITVRRKLIEGVEAGPGSERGKARQINGHRQAITDSEERKVQATRIVGDLERYLASLKVPPLTPPPAPPRPVRR
jgi:tetratricopeptide (TPR) repeat protein